MDDPAGNSYIQSLTEDAVDPRLSKDFYTRTYEQNDELGLNDMKVENYENLPSIQEEEWASLTPFKLYTLVEFNKILLQHLSATHLLTCLFE